MMKNHRISDRSQLTRLQCINQADNLERTLQVAQMRDIYRSASEVIVFLGNGRHHRILGSSRDQFPGRQAVFDHSCSDDALTSQFLAKWRKPPAKPSARALDTFCLLRILTWSQRQPLEPFDPLDGVPDAGLRCLFEALRMMMRSPWWDRMWVVQEIIVASNVMFQYGNVSVPWSILTEAALAHTQMDSLPDEYKIVLKFFSRRVTDIEHRRGTWKMVQKMTLLELLREFSDRRASDDRDKIYALLGLCTEPTTIVPDYSLDVKSAYIWATVYAIHTTGRLSVLNGDLGRKNRQDLPSWVPDWSATFDEHDRRRADLFGGEYTACNSVLATIDSSMLGGQAASWHNCDLHNMRRLVKSLQDGIGAKQRLPQFYRGILQSYGRQFPGPIHQVCDELAELCHLEGERYADADRCTIREDIGCLHLWGNKIGMAVTASEPLFSSTDIRAAVSAWIQVLHHYRDQVGGRYEIDVPAVRLSFATTLVAHTTATSNGLRRLIEKDTRALLDWFERRIMDAPRPPPTTGSLETFKAETLDSFTHAMRMAATRRVFFITDKGKMGLGPASMRAGDVAYILPGGRVPFILRPQGRPNVFTLIGDCYIEGAMDGSHSGGLADNDQPDRLPGGVFTHMVTVWEAKARSLDGLNYRAFNELMDLQDFEVERPARWWQLHGQPWQMYEDMESLGHWGWDKLSPERRSQVKGMLREMRALDTELSRIYAESMIIV